MKHTTEGYVPILQLHLLKVWSKFKAQMIVLCGGKCDSDKLSSRAEMVGAVGKMAAREADVEMTSMGIISSSQASLLWSELPSGYMVIIAFRHYLAQRDHIGPTHWRFAQSSLSRQRGMCIQTIKHMASFRLIWIFPERASSIGLTAMFAMRVMIAAGD